MKKSWQMIFLFPLVLIVWGYVIHYCYKYFFSHEIPIQSSYMVPSGDSISSYDKFPGYDPKWRDPFLQNHIAIANPSTSAGLLLHKPKSNTIQLFEQKPIISLPPDLPKPVPIKWPEITYLGWIINKSSGVRSVQLNIDNKSIHLVEGERYKDVEVHRIWGDSVKISYKNGYKIFELKKK